MTKTHWLQSPNKNYLGHFDLPGGEPVILTIRSAQWEEVKNPITKTSEAKRVVRFKEEHSWVKPFICNETNAQSILNSVKEKFMEDCEGKCIKLNIAKAAAFGKEVDCLRVSSSPQRIANAKKINKEQVEEILHLLETAEMDVINFCKAVKVSSVSEVPDDKYGAYIARLYKIIEAKNESN